MMNMIQYGAQEIIVSDQADEIEANIDHIIERSMKKTEKINELLSNIEDKFNLNNVSLTGEDEKYTSLYTFEGEEYSKKKINSAEQAVDFIDFGPRERKQLNYDIDKYYRNAFNTPSVAPKEKKKLKGWRLIANGGYDH